MIEELVIHSQGAATCQRQADRVDLQISISCKAVSKEQSEKLNKETADKLQDLAREHARSSSDAIADWTMEAATTTHDKSVYEYAYETRSSLQLSFRSVRVLPFFTDTIANLKYANVTNTTWYLSKTTLAALKAEARKAALQDAIDRASDFAEVATGSRKVRMSTIEDNGASYEVNANGIVGGGRFKGLDAPMKSSVETLSPGQVCLTWKVSAKFTADGQGKDSSL